MDDALTFAVQIVKADADYAVAASVSICFSDMLSVIGDGPNGHVVIHGRHGRRQRTLQPLAQPFEGLRRRNLVMQVDIKSAGLPGS